MKKKTKLLISLFLTVVLAVGLCAISANADNRVSRIDVNVSLASDGSAVITQVWQGDFDEGTECYIPFNTNGYHKLTDFSVSSEGEQFVYSDSWDIDASFDQKAYSCGLNPTDDGYELCWGISSYGEHTYTLSYIVSDVVGAYTDSDGFNFMFINSGMNTGPTDASVTIRMADGSPISDETANIWAFGYDGTVNFRDDGTVYAVTNEPLYSSNYMTVMLELDKGVISPLTAFDESFETVKNAAFEGSDYSSGVPWLAFVFFFLFIAIIGFVVISTIAGSVKFNKFKKGADYFRDIPNGGDMNATFFLSKLFSLTKEGNIIGAQLLKMITAGYIESVSDEQVGFMGKTKSTLSMRLVKQPPEEDAFSFSLYSLLDKAAGDDNVLQPKELEKYCSKHPSSLRSFIGSCEGTGRKSVCAKGCFSGRVRGSLAALTEAGRKELAEIIGFKKYMLDFSLISEHEISAAAIWQDFMVYAMLLDISDEVAEQLKKVYPQYVPDIERFETNVTFAYLYYNSMYSSMIAREQQIQAQRVGGSGGGASFGGGGGFSGGGFGGGTR